MPGSQDGSALAVSVPGNVNVALPWYYMLLMLFVFDAAGVPSVARRIRRMIRVRESSLSGQEE
jgi:hypothetical protein